MRPRWPIALLAALVCLLPQFSAAQTPLNQPQLAFDSLTKETTARAASTNVLVSYMVTNVSTAAVTIQDATTSCGCSVARLPARPWVLKPGEAGKVEVVTDVRGKRGVLVKSLLLQTSLGLRVATYKVTILEPLNAAERAKNAELAKVDRQAVFKGDCAKCHAEPAKGKTGRELFAVACGICHEAEHRASMVPDLKSLNKPTPRDYWLQWVAHGKPDTLMPAFAAKEGGPLSEEQVRSLAEFLDDESRKPKRPVP